MILSLIIGFLIGAAFIVFALQSTEVVSLAFLGWQFESPLVLISLLLFTAGVLLTAILSMPGMVRDSLRIRRLEKTVSSLRQEPDAANEQIVGLTVSSAQSVEAPLDLRP